MIKTNIFSETDTRKITQQKGCFSVMEYTQDMSVDPKTAIDAYFASKMNIRKKQVIAQLRKQSGVILQSGAMQMMVGDVSAATNIKGALDVGKKFVNSKVTGESVIKPQYKGNGLVVFEPTYKYILLENITEWGGSMVIEDGMFLACDNTIDLHVSARKSLSSAVLGNEGLFNTELRGEGIAVLESPVPREELIVVDLENDEIRIDGNMAIAWSSSLKFEVKKTTSSLIGSAASGEGFVNCYRGTGRIMIAPVM